jgi:hypothetical protein
MAVYAYNTTVKLTGTFYDTDGLLADPPDVRCNIRRPDGSLITSTISVPGSIVQREAQGVYFAIIRATEVGRWCYAWEAAQADPPTGSQPADETYFDVRPTAFGI